MRINQFVASSTGLSRRAADTKIAEGRVLVNGHPAMLGQPVQAGDSVTFDGLDLKPRSTQTYVILHKPEGYISSRTRQSDDPTLYELLPEKYHTLRIAGRLDRDSSGLIILSDDGPFIQKLTHPSADKTKRYELTLESALSDTDRLTLERGVPLTDGISRITIKSVVGKTVIVSLSEGRNRQLRRTFGALGYTITKLHRTNVGPFAIDGLARGAWAETTATGSAV